MKKFRKFSLFIICYSLRSSPVKTGAYSLFSLYFLAAIRYLLFAIYYSLFAAYIFADMGGAGASPEWGTVQKKIAIQSGIRISAWEVPERSDVSVSQYGVPAAPMTPVGDGTYQIRFDLIPTAEYNFIFFAKPTQELPGLNLQETYYDAIPNSGSDAAFIVSDTTTNPAGNNKYLARYISIGGDARRYLRVPDVPAGTTCYVYCNWASTPLAPTNFRARPDNGKVHLSWSAPYGHWGTGSERYKAIDVIAGGAYIIYRSSISASGPYEIVATTPGYCFSWTDTNVQNGMRYYYAISSSDAYRGSVGGNFADIGLSSSLDLSPKLPATPGVSVPVRFRVHNIDWKVVEKNDFLVWLTPDNVNDRYSSEYKIQSRLVAVKVPKTLRDRWNDFVKFFRG